jgi:hypothetical protein
VQRVVDAEIAAERPHVAERRRGDRLDGPRESGVAALNRRMGGDVREERRGADPHLAVRMHPGEVRDAHQAHHGAGLLVPALHVGPEVGAPGHDADGETFERAPAGEHGGGLGEALGQR